MVKETHQNSFLDFTDARFKVLTPESWDRSQLRSLLPLMRDKNILVIGDVGVDRYISGKVDRISPEAPVPIVWVENENQKLGLAANISDNIRSFGASSFLVGVIGEDRGAEDLKSLLDKQKIKSHFLVSDSTRKTIIKERIVSQNQQLMRIDYESSGKISSHIHEKVLSKVKECISNCDIVVFEDYSKGLATFDFCQNLISIVNNAGKKILVDPHRNSSLAFYRGLSLIKPNKKEAEILTQVEIKDNDSLLHAGRVLMADTGAEHVFLTLGKDGMAVFSKTENSKTFIVPTSAREVYDVSGAGDTVISVLALLLSSGTSLEEAAVLANIAGGIVVGKFGTATTDIQEMIQEIDRY